MVYSEVTWIFVAATCAALFVAYGIGANDVANSFGTSVGAGALTMKQALLVAAICEFSGALLMGAGVTDTIRSQISKPQAFEDRPDVFAYGMLCSLLASGLWLMLATYWEIPVSTTHSIIGAVVGMTMVVAGPDAVNWSQHTDRFPFLGGISSILLSWLFSPILTGALSLTIFALLRALVLRSPHAYNRAFYVLPVFVFLTFFMISMFIIEQGGIRFGWDHTPTGKACWVSVCVGTGTTVLAVTVQWLFIRKRVARDLKQEMEDAAARAAVEAVFAADAEAGVVQLEGAHDEIISDVLGQGDPLSFGFSQFSQLSQVSGEDGSSGHNRASGFSPNAASAAATAAVPAAAAAAAAAAVAMSPTASSAAAGRPAPGLSVAVPGRSRRGGGVGGQSPSHGVASAAAAGAHTPQALHKFRQSRVWSALTHGANFDIHEVIETDEKINSIHYYSERFDWKAESVFKYLQVFTAMANSFAHGSNDVANAVGPYAAVYFVWQYGTRNRYSDAAVPEWILAIGGLGIVLGLATYGYKIMRVLGVKMTRLTNSRGFVVEISAATIVVLGSRYSLPISTTHCLVGAVAGIGLLEGSRGFNWVLILRFFVGWVATLVVAGLTAALFTAQGVYSPTVSSADQRTYMANYLQNTSQIIAQLLNATGVPEYQAYAAAINQSLAGLPYPLLYLPQGAEVQLQAMQSYQAATVFATNATAGS